MQYSNPELPEGINTSKTHPLKEFLILTAGVIGSLFLIISLLIYIVDHFADKIPFSVEQNLPIASFFEKNKSSRLPDYLDQLASKVISHSDLPEGMTITIHYSNSDTVNAYATLGGHIVLYRGLLEKLKSENEIAMVIGHEIGHVKHRHPVLSASHGIVVGLVLSILSTSAGDSVVSNLLGTTSSVTLMRYSREYEYQADQEAINTLIKIYGHAGGALQLFNVFEKEAGKSEPVEFLNTHPLTKNRISQAHTLIEKQNLLQQYSLTPIPLSFANWLTQQKLESESSNKKKMSSR